MVVTLGLDALNLPLARRSNFAERKVRVGVAAPAPILGVDGCRTAATPTRSSQSELRPPRKGEVGHVPLPSERLASGSAA